MSFNLIAANDALLDPSVMKYSPLDCQRPELLNKKMVEGKILLCGYSFNFVSGTASIKKVSETARSLGAAGFVVAVENTYAGAKLDPVPVSTPGILIADLTKSQVLIMNAASSILVINESCVLSSKIIHSMKSAVHPCLYSHG